MAMLLAGSSATCGHLQTSRQSQVPSFSGAFSRGCALRQPQSVARVQRCKHVCAAAGEAPAQAEQGQRRAPSGPDSGALTLALM